MARIPRQWPQKAHKEPIFYRRKQREQRNYLSLLRKVMLTAPYSDWDTGNTFPRITRIFADTASVIRVVSVIRGQDIIQGSGPDT